MLCKRNSLRLLLSLFLSLAFLGSQAQEAVASKDDGTASGDKSKTRINGRVMDAKSQQAIEYATISVLREADSSLVTGASSDDKGFFTIPVNEFGKFIVKIDFMGYKSQYLPTVELSNKKPVHTTAPIALAPNNKLLNEVEVAAEKDQMQLSIDKKVYNVGKDITTTGSSATQVLQNVPSVTVDQDGTINLRGSSNVRILINGKPSNISGNNKQAVLEQIPASAIESVEVITNPSAKYDAEGMAGILNIVLKKDHKQGLGGNVQVTSANNDKYSASLNINGGGKKVTFNLGYDYRNFTFWNKSEIKRNTSFSDTLRSFKQDGEGFQRDWSHTLRGGLDYNINEKNSAYINGMTTLMEWRNHNNFIYKNYDNSENIQSQSFRNSVESNHDKMINVAAGYKHSFAKKDQQWTIDGVFNQNQGPLITNIQAGTVMPATSSLLQHTHYDELQRSTIVQTDYAHPISEKVGKIEGGAKATMRIIDSEYKLSNYADSTKSYEVNPLFSNHFVYNEQVYAAYLNYSNQIGKWGIQSGLRMENTNTQSDLLTTAQSYDKAYTNFFPSLFISRELKNGHRLQASYTQRINRPNQFMLNPFPDYSDPLNIRTGNPNLRPELIHSYELNWVKYSDKMAFMKNVSFNASVYYRRGVNLFRRALELQPNGVSYLNFTNIGYGDYYGAEFTVSASIQPWWKIMWNGNLFTSMNYGGEKYGNVKMNMIWNRISSTFTVPKLFDLQITNMYRSPFDVINGRINAFSFTEIGIRRNILGDKGSISVRMSDIFNTQRFAVNNYGSNYLMDSYWKRETRILYVSLTYRFNNVKHQLRQRPNLQDGGGGIDSGGY